jgi:hypothetical protein
MSEDIFAGTGLTDAHINAIADRAADRALEKVYAQVGASVIKKLMWILGVIALAVFAWLSGKGIVSVPSS